MFFENVYPSVYANGFKAGGLPFCPYVNHVFTVWAKIPPNHSDRKFTHDRARNV
jgi:hypothetical protein